MPSLLKAFMCSPRVGADDRKATIVPCGTLALKLAGCDLEQPLSVAALVSAKTLQRTRPRPSSLDAHNSPVTAADPLLSFRSHFPILERSTYLVSNSLGAMPSQVGANLERYAEEWATRGVRAWAEGWWDMPARMGDGIAPLIGAEPGHGTRW